MRNKLHSCKVSAVKSAIGALLQMEKPRGILAVAGLFFGTAGYLVVLGILMLARPGLVSMSSGSWLLLGLQTWGPFMFLLCGGLGIAIGFGLMRLNNWARRAAYVVAMLGVAMLVPSVSSGALYVQLGRLAWGGLGIIVRVIVVWYLSQTPVKEMFEKT
ncbi:MAG TPA: hypothetical protein VFV14_05545 [Myxococcaceae bacterium]|nr:hypothetical protein [Myxococcaceae bacterium]